EFDANARWAIRSPNLQAGTLPLAKIQMAGVVKRMYRSKLRRPAARRQGLRHHLIGTAGTLGRQPHRCEEHGNRNHHSLAQGVHPLLHPTMISEVCLPACLPPWLYSPVAWSPKIRPLTT